MRLLTLTLTTLTHTALAMISCPVQAKEPAHTGVSAFEFEEILMTPMLTRWPATDLRKIAEADGLHITTFREDGVTYRAPTWIWSVAVNGELYVRAYSGKKSRWYQAAMRQRAGRIMTDGMICDVYFEPVDGLVNDRIDDTYRAKYGVAPT
jgi:hypothetical protein